MVRCQEELPYLRRRRQNEVVLMCGAVSVCLCVYIHSCLCIYLSIVCVHVSICPCVCVAMSVLLSVWVCVYVSYV